MNQTEMLKKLEWSGILQEAFIHIPSSCCPECSRVPDRGHTKTCELNRLINLPQIDCPMTAHEVRKASEHLHRNFRWITGKELRKLADWIDLQKSQPSTLPKEKP